MQINQQEGTYSIIVIIKMLTLAIMLKFHNLTVFSTTNNEWLDIHCILHTKDMLLA